MFRANDLLLFCQGRLPSVQILMNEFREFSAASGLLANETKSCVYFSGVNGGLQQQILQLIGFVQGVFPMKYLGVPMSLKKWSKLDCHRVVTKIVARIVEWSASHLFYTRRLQLVQIVPQSIQVYWASTFILPTSVLREVDCRCSSFL